MKNILAQHGRSILAASFLAVILAGPICTVMVSLRPFVGTQLAGLLAVALHLV
jgi:hypothetical protein